ncbi:unnamed protein product [Gadus morhua 'NCC']
MPHKSKKEKGSNKKQPPATQAMRVRPPGSHSATKKEKRYSTSCFPLSTNRDLQKLTPLSAFSQSLYVTGSMSGQTSANRRAPSLVTSLTSQFPPAAESFIF